MFVYDFVYATPESCIMVMALELRLHSPAGADPNVYKWPLTSGRGAVSVNKVPLLFQTLRFNLIQTLKTALLKKISRYESDNLT